MGSTVLHLLCVMDAEATFFVQKHCIEMCPLYLIGPGSLEWARPPPSLHAPDQTLTPVGMTTTFQTHPQTCQLPQKCATNVAT